jgi:EAL domain-containing protein (putative c-di-GMP-specific phosphodiesterase class I)
MLKLGVDIIKIDKIFVDVIGTDRNSTTIVETLVDLARNMRLDAVAEGAENFEQVMHLRTLDVRLAQGYVFAPRQPGARPCSSSKPSIPCRPQLRPRLRTRRPSVSGRRPEALQKRKGAALRPPS